MTVYTTVSTPKPLVDGIKLLIEKLGYWPSITAFVREAILEKMHREIEMQKTLKDYAANVFEKFIHEYNPEGEPFEMNTGQAFHYELEHLKKQDRTISRASIIFELKKMADMDPLLLVWREMTGKGGHHRIYRLAKSPHEIEVDVVTHLLQRIKKNWPKAYSEVIRR